MRVSGVYVVWRGREYVPGGPDPRTRRIVIQFYGPEPFEEGFERKRREPRHRWPTWSRWVPIDEIERKFGVNTVGVWRDAEFRVFGQSDDEDVAAGDVDVLIDGPVKGSGVVKPLSWWQQLEPLKFVDRSLVFGWVPWSELTDLREEIEDEPLPFSDA